MNEVAIGECEGAGNDLGTSPKNETLGSPPNTISTGMSFAKVKSIVLHGIMTVLMYTGASASSIEDLCAFFMYLF